LNGRIALVTGAERNMGFETARGLAQRGMVVYLTSCDPAAGPAAAETLKGEGGDVRYLFLDVTDEASMRDALAVVDREHGRLDVLVNNAGVALEPRDALSAEPDEIRRTMEVNLHGPMRLLQLAVPLLRRSAHGRVVNVSSAASRFGYFAQDPRPNPYAYCLSKAGVNTATVMFSQLLAADGIKVNAVLPGYVKSPISSFKGTRTPAEGARVMIKYATIDDDGPTGGLFDENGPASW
jgi:NAD(P)-dependent dehydrogenase (short-subunit alcohol dehydrogenase family)